MAEPAISKNDTKAAIGFLAGAVALGAATFPAREADASGLTNLNQLQNSYNLAADPMYKWSAAVRRTDSTGVSYASGVLIAPDLFITAGHVAPRDNSATAALNEIVFGANYNTSSDRYSISHTQRYPGYVFGNPATIDLGVAWTNSFVAGFDTPTRFESVAEDVQLTLVDYGNYGDSTTGELPSQGFKMAGRQPKRNFSSNGYPYPTYFTGNFDGPLASDPLNVLGLNGSSGAAYYSPTGGLSSIHIAGSNNLNSGFSIELSLNDPSVQAYLQPLIQDSWDRYNASVPSPSSFAVLGVVALAGATRRRR